MGAMSELSMEKEDQDNRSDFYRPSKKIVSDLNFGSYLIPADVEAKRFRNDESEDEVSSEIKTDGESVKTKLGDIAVRSCDPQNPINDYIERQIERLSDQGVSTPAGAARRLGYDLPTRADLRKASENHDGIKVPPFLEKATDPERCDYLKIEAFIQSFMKNQNKTRDEVLQIMHLHNDPRFKNTDKKD